MSQLQFELWEECNSRCKFCYLGKANQFTPNEKKMSNIQKTIDKISDMSIYKDIDCLAYIGGEFFQGQLSDVNVKNKFFELMTITSNLVKDNVIREVWLSASLITKKQEYLKDVIELFEDKSKLWILTSYDTIGRFHSQQGFEIWLSNLKMLRLAYPKLKINITSILTGDFINKYLEGNNKLFTIAKEYQCQVFLKPPCSIDDRDKYHLSKKETNEVIPNFYPQRHKFLEFLYKFKTLENDIQYQKLFNMQMRSDYLVKYGDEIVLNHRIKDKSIEEQDGESDLLSCNHSTQYAIYVDSDECAICDKKMILDELN